MRRILVVVFALAFAIACNIVLLFLAVASDPVTGKAMAQLLAGLFDEVIAPDQAWISGASAALALSALSHALAAVCVLPQALSALLAEAARVRSLIWHMIVPGVIAAATPWLLRAALRVDTAPGDQTPVENRFLALFFICAALSGAIYWVFTRRRAPVAKA